MTDRDAPEGSVADGERPAASLGARLHDIGPRIGSALVLAPLAVAAAVAGGPWLAGACGAAAVAMSYEWARMSEPGSPMPAFWLCLTGVLGAVMASSWGQLAIATAWLLGCAGISALRRRSAVGVLETFLGVLYVGLPCALFLALRDHEIGGKEAILGMFSIIWATDAAAYFGGTLIGGPRVSSWLSPNKTWTGLASGTLAGAGAGAIFAGLVGGPAALWSLTGAVIGATGLLGDLFESALKRRFGVKDASALIPGHGGFLDRLDSMIAATLLASAALWADPGLLPRLLGRPA